MLLFYILGLQGLFAQDAVRMPASVHSTITHSVSKYVFEVLFKKLPLELAVFKYKFPIDLLPYHVRNDEYVSIGTAFAIGHGKWMSAAHVIRLNTSGYNHQYFIRDANGKVYELDQVLNYSLHKDFIVFTLKNKPLVKGFKIQKKPRLNETVFSVGNAYGEGIIVREGTLTSYTKDYDLGKWEYLRFSAPASFGNSGGPLLNQQAEVVGIIVMKTSAENLNYAIPMKEVSLNPQKIDVADKVNIKKLNASFYEVERFSKSYVMPQGIKEFWEALKKDYDDFLVEAHEKFSKKFQSNLFPLSETSKRLLNTLPNLSKVPGIVTEESTEWVYKPGLWSKELYFPNSETLTKVFLPDFSGWAFHAQRQLPSLDIFDDPKLHSYYVLKSNNVSLNVQDVREPIEMIHNVYFEECISDQYGRKWLIRFWQQPLSGELIASATILTPSGFIVLADIVRIEDMQLFYHSIKLLLNDIFFNYVGSLPQWKKFFELSDAKKFKNVLPVFVEQKLAFWNNDILNFKLFENVFKLENKYLFEPATDMISVSPWVDIQQPTLLRFKGFGVKALSQQGFFIKPLFKPTVELNPYNPEWIYWQNVMNQSGTFNGKAFQESGMTRLLKVNIESDQKALLIDVFAAGNQEEWILESVVNNLKKIF